MSKMRVLYNALLTYFFVCVASMAAVLVYINRDSTLLCLLLAAILLAIIVLFLWTTGFSAKGKIITFCGAAVFGVIWFLAYSASGFPSYSTAAAMGARFRGLSDWEIACVHQEKSYLNRFGGIPAFYDVKRKRFWYLGLNKDNVKDIEVLVLFSYSEPYKIGSYSNTKTGEHYADATTRDLTIRLVDPETKVCFDEKVFSGGSRGKITNRAQASSSTAWDGPTVRRYLEKFFKPNTLEIYPR